MADGIAGYTRANASASSMPESSRGFLGDVDPSEEVGADGDCPMSRACTLGPSGQSVGRVLQASGVMLGWYVLPATP